MKEHQGRKGTIALVEVILVDQLQDRLADQVGHVPVLNLAQDHGPVAR